MKISETTTHFRVDGEPCRSGAGAAFSLCAIYFATGRMCEADRSISMRPDEHGRGWHATPRPIGYILLLYLSSANPAIAVQDNWSFSGGTHRGSRPNGWCSPHSVLSAGPRRTGSLTSLASIPSLHIPDL